jgi:Raf kinase inhibitor-like YbhB/YbcL family protein
MALQRTALTLTLALASCGSSAPATRQFNDGGPVDNADPAKISLTSAAFRDGDAIPVQYTCDGADETPLLKWGEPPAGTKSFALVVDDPDAPSGTFRHWGAYDIPRSARSIGGGQHVGAEVANDFAKSGYGGPCPPKGHGRHHYHFKLFALNVARSNLGPQAKVMDVEEQAAKHSIGQGELVGTYERK